MSTTTVEQIGSNSLRLSNPDLPGGQIEVRGGTAGGAVSTALEFLKGLGTLSGPAPKANVAVHLAQVPDAPKIKRRRRKRSGSSLPRPWSESDVAGLGTMPDADYAKKIDRTPGAVTAQRHVQKIAPFNNGTKRRGRKPAAAATAAT